MRAWNLAMRGASGYTHGRDSCESDGMNKHPLSERDICTKFITPHLIRAGWDIHTQIREEVSFTDGRIHVRGKMHTRGARKRADYILYYKPDIPIAVIEAKDNNHTVSAGIQQALGYAEILDIPFVFSSNGDAFLFHDRTVTSGDSETELALDAFPSPAALWEKYRVFKDIQSAAEPVVSQDYFTDGSGGRQPSPPGHGDRHGKDLRRVSDYLSAVEKRPEETHPFPRRPNRAH